MFTADGKSNLLCVYGGKCFKSLTLCPSDYPYGDVVEVEDWIWDVAWIKQVNYRNIAWIKQVN